MTATATAKNFATGPQIRFLSSLYAERVPFGYDATWDEDSKLFLPVNVLTVAEASEFITAGKRADRKPAKGTTEHVAPGYYVKDVPGQCEGHERALGAHMGELDYCTDNACKPAQRTVFVVVPSKRNPGRTYAKQLVVDELTKRARWIFCPGGVQELAGIAPLTLDEAKALGKKYGVCMICARQLTDDTNKGPDGLTSIQRGIGPVCMKNEGLAR